MNTSVQNNNVISCELSAVEMENIQGGIDPISSLCFSIPDMFDNAVDRLKIDWANTLIDMYNGSMCA